MNQFGLSRNIPSEVKRKVRQRDGFGCVICGKGIYQYEHVDPEYHDAKIHDYKCIAFLCPNCHSEVTTNRMSKDVVKKAMCNPLCKQKGYTRSAFWLSNGHPALRFGGILLENCAVPIEVSGLPLFSIKPSESQNTPFLFSGTFTDSDEKITLKIVDNEWEADSNQWDVEVVGNNMTIREGLRGVKLALVIRDFKEVVVERLSMSLYGWHFEANKDSLEIYWKGSLVKLSSCIKDNSMVGLSLDKDGGISF